MPSMYSTGLQLKIAYFVNKFPLISETFILEQITAMIDRGHDVQIFATGRPDSHLKHSAVDQYSLLDRTTFLEPMPRSPITRIRLAIGITSTAIKAGRVAVVLRALNVVRFRRAALDLSLLLRTAPYIGRPGFDILHCQFGDVAVSLLPLIKIGVLSGRLVTSFRGWDATQYPALYPGRYRDLFSLGDAFLPVSHSLEQRLQELGCPRDRVTVLRSGVDLTQFRFRDKKKIGQPVNLITIGRLTEKKGVEFGIRAVDQLLRAGYDVEYKIVGDGPLRNTLCNLVQKLARQQRISFLGAVDSETVVSLLEEADIFLAPSVTGKKGDQEGIPNSLKEAMAIGIPVIGTDHGGISELIDNNVNGFMVGEGKSEDVVTIIKNIVASPDSVNDLIVEARKTVEEKFDVEVLNDKLEEIYARLR